MKTIAQISPAPQPTYQPTHYYPWMEVSFVAACTFLLTLMFVKWWPQHRDKQAEREYTVERERETNQVELIRTLIAKQLNQNSEVIENMAFSQQNISLGLEAQLKQYKAIAEGFKTSTANQERQIKVLEKIVSILEKYNGN